MKIQVFVKLGNIMLTIYGIQIARKNLYIKGQDKSRLDRPSSLKLRLYNYHRGKGLW